MGDFAALVLPIARRVWGQDGVAWMWEVFSRKRIFMVRAVACILQSYLYWQATVRALFWC